MIDEAIGQLTPLVGMTNALATVGADRATWYRHHRQSPAPVRPQRVAAPPPRLTVALPTRAPASLLYSGGPGGMAERPNARLLKSLGVQAPGGSNPSPSAGQRVSLGRGRRIRN